MKRFYSKEQRKNGVKQEQNCRSYFFKHGVHLIPLGNCVERFCPNGCDDCIDDEFCKPDYRVECIPATIEVTGYNSVWFNTKPGLWPSEPLFLTHCKVRNFLEAFQTGRIAVCYVWHYSNFIKRCPLTGKLIVDQPNVIRIIRMNGEFLDAYLNDQFESITKGCEYFIEIPYDSEFLISSEEMLGEIETLIDQHCPDLYRYAPWN